jgi:hypothetical protein
MDPAQGHARALPLAVRGATRRGATRVAPGHPSPAHLRRLFPGPAPPIERRVPVTRRLAFQGGPASPDTPKVPCYRALDGAGRPLEGAAVPHPLGEEDALRLYVAMAKMQVWLAGVACGVRLCLHMTMCTSASLLSMELCMCVLPLTNL